MHMPIKWGHEGPLSAIMPEHHITMPVIPAAVGVLSFIVGMLLGVMVGHKKCMVHEGMMGMKGAWSGGWSEKGKMGKWGKMGKPHHHHGEGAPPCDCGMILIAEEDLGMGGMGGMQSGSGTQESSRSQSGMGSSEGTGMGAGGGMSSGMEE